jgi:hypothetical protein
MVKAKKQVVEQVVERPKATIVNTDEYGQLLDFGFISGKPFRLGRGKCKAILDNIELVKQVAESAEVAKSDNKDLFKSLLNGKGGKLNAKAKAQLISMLLG